MLIVDSSNAPRLEKGARHETQEEKMRGWVAEQTQHAFYVKDNDFSPANAERQLGKQFWPRDLEARLKKLNPNLHFETNAFNPSKKALYHLRRGEGKVFICAYENSIMPEHSIIRVKEELVQDFDFMKKGADGLSRMHLDRKDLPTDPENAIPLGMKKVLVPWGEFTRGWRTVTIKLVEAKIATPTQIETLFGADNRPEWAAHMGKQKLQLPW